MKKLFLIVAVAFLATGTFAQSEKYIASMKSNIAAIDTSFKNPSNLLTLANNFERIATAEKTQWLAYYYAAFARLIIPIWSRIKQKLMPLPTRQLS